MEERDFEKEAREEGWVPKEEWKGPGEKWVDAETFVKRGEEIIPILNAKNRKLVEELSGLKSQVAELLEGNKQFKSFHDDAMKAKEVERERLIQELEAARQKAIDDGDGKSFTEADKQLQQVREQKPNGQDKQKVSLEAEKWLEENPRYKSDRKFKAAADGIAEMIQEEVARGRRAKLTQEEYFKALDNGLKEEFPELFENPNRDRSTVEDGGNRSNTSSKAKTYENLPDDAKRACDNFVKTIPGFTQEQYLKEYAWE